MGIIPGLIDLERPGYIQVKAGNLVKVGNHHNLTFTIAMKSGLAELGIFARRDGCIPMMDNQIMQKKLGCDAEGKYQ